MNQDGEKVYYFDRLYGCIREAEPSITEEQLKENLDRGLQTLKELIEEVDSAKKKT